MVARLPAGAAARASRCRPLVPYAGVAAVPVAVACAFAGLGAGYVLDDWFFTANARFEGALSVTAGHGGQRPAAVPLWALVFGPWAGRPVPALLLMAVANATFAVCLALLLRRVLPERAALAVALVWVVLPTHTSLEVWVTCVNIAWSQAAAAGALVVGWREGRRWWHLAASGALVAFAVLSYEATVAVAAVAFVVLPWLRRGRPDWPLLGVAAASASAGLAWVVTHWFDAKQARELAPVEDVFVANTGWAFTGPGTGADVVTVAALAAVVLAVARLALPSFRSGAGPAERLMVAGIGVMVAGTVPFALYVYEPLGAGDRMNGLSAVGGALFLVGVGWLVASRSRAAAGALALAALVAATATRAERMELWHLAGRDAGAIVGAVVARVPDPAGGIVVGPEPISRGRIVAFLESSSVRSALRVAYDDPTVRARMTQSLDQFLAAAQPRIDIRPLSRLDDP